MIGDNVVAGQRLRLADLDAVTLDAYGTLLELDDPIGALAQRLPGFDREAIARAFRAEGEYYTENSHRGGDAASLEQLYEACVRVFNEHLGSSLTAHEYVGAFRYRWLDGAREAVEKLRARGLALAVVADWDISLVERLAPLRVPVFTSAAFATRKPDPAPFLAALERLGVAPERAVHVGDHEKDEQGAAAAGMRFAPTPLADAVATWT